MRRGIELSSTNEFFDEPGTGGWTWMNPLQRGLMMSGERTVQYLQAMTRFGTPLHQMDADAVASSGRDVSAKC
jgi:hypothetical protein